MTNKKKIGIVTYWESNDNYGQQLQCWALQYYLRSQGYNAFLIRQYVWPPMSKTLIKRIKSWIKNIIANILYITHLAYVPFIAKYFKFCLNKETCRRRFPLFRRKHLKMTKIYDHPHKLVQNPPQADVYITGSDQVWNYSMPEEPLSNFFLQFGEDSVKRISYAPSIGHANIPDSLTEKLSDYLSRFSAISVRESSAVSLVEKLGYHATSVLDPTMLLCADDYLKLAKNEKGKKSVFIYSMNYESRDDIPFDAIRQFATNHELPIIVTPGSGYTQAKELFEEVKYSYATIPQWITHIANAELVVTASFHGVVFAILFHRSFIYTPLKGQHASANNRVLDLLHELGLSTQIYSKSIEIGCYEISKEQWQNAINKLNVLINHSKRYLVTAIDGEN